MNQNNPAKLIAPTLIYAILYTLFLYRNFAGITVPLFALATVVYSFYCLKLFDIKLKAGSLLYAAVIMLLGVSSCMTGSLPIITFNTIGICLMLLCMLLHNFFYDDRWDFLKYTGAIFMSIFGAFGEIASPFVDLYSYEKNKENKSKGLYVIIGLCIAFPLLIIIVSLLYFADAVFADVISRSMHDISLFNIIGVIFTFAFAFMSAYCGMKFLNKRNLSEEVTDKRKFEPIIAFTVLGLISFIYIFFSGIQILYLFYGNMALPDGYTYASYAREGFFQLLFVCILNLVIVLFVMKFFKENIIVKFLLTIISACTYIMLASSAYRMCMYVQNYCLTFLRVFVFWALALLAVLLLGILVQIFVPKFHLFKYGLVVVCVFYLTLSFAHVDYFIARFNLDYVAANGGSVDFNYLINLSSDAAPAIADQDDDWVDMYAYKQIKYKEDGLRKFNFSHSNAVKAFSEYIDKHDNFYCFVLTAEDGFERMIDNPKLESIECQYYPSDGNMPLKATSTDKVTNPLTGNTYYVAYIPKDICDSKKPRITVSYKLNYKNNGSPNTTYSDDVWVDSDDINILRVCDGYYIYNY